MRMKPAWVRELQAPRRATLSRHRDVPHWAGGHTDAVAQNPPVSAAAAHLHGAHFVDRVVMVKAEPEEPARYCLCKITTLTEKRAMFIPGGQRRDVVKRKLARGIREIAAGSGGKCILIVEEGVVAV